MVQFLSINLFSWISSIFVGFFQKFPFFVSPCTIRRYELHFHPVPHGLTVSCARYAQGFPVYYGSPSDVFAASSGFVHLYTLGFKGKEKRTDGGDVSRCTSRPAQAVTVSSL